MRRADAIDATVGNNIRVFRLARDMSQGALAKKVGVSFQQLQKYEMGTNRISAGRVWRFARIFDVPITALYEGVEGRLGNEPSALSLLTNRDAVRLVQAFDKIADRTVRKSLVVLLENIAG